jgi:hypothetical protein
MRSHRARAEATKPHEPTSHDSMGTNPSELNRFVILLLSYIRALPWRNIEPSQAQIRVIGCQGREEQTRTTSHIEQRTTNRLFEAGKSCLLHSVGMPASNRFFIPVCVTIEHLLCVFFCRFHLHHPAFSAATQHAHLPWFNGRSWDGVLPKVRLVPVVRPVAEASSRRRTAPRNGHPPEGPPHSNRAAG